VWNLWFEDQPGNASLPNLDEVKETFMAGGFYRVDLNDNLAVLVLNSMYFMIDNDQSVEGDVP